MTSRTKVARVILDGRRQVNVLFDKLRHEFIKQAEKIMRYQYLPVAGVSCPDPDGGNPELPGNEGGNYVGYALQNDGKDPGLLKGLGVLQQTPCRFHIFALNLEAAQLPCGLRSQPDMPHDRYAGPDNRFNLRTDFPAPFQLDGIATRLLQEPAGIGDGAFDAHLVRKKRHIPHQKAEETPRRTALQ